MARCPDRRTERMTRGTGGMARGPARHRYYYCGFKKEKVIENLILSPLMAMTELRFDSDILKTRPAGSNLA